jgi:hypothetical protein
MHAVGQGVVLRVNVPGGDVAGAGPFEGFGLQSTSGQSQGCTQNGQSVFHWLTPESLEEICTMQHPFQIEHGANPHP